MTDALRGGGVARQATQTPYPRADPADDRLPATPGATAQIPVGVRLELIGDASAVEIDYTCATDDLGYRGEGAGTSFSAWRGDQEVGEARRAASTAAPPSLRLAAAPPTTSSPSTCPEGMRPTLFGGAAPSADRSKPRPRGPRWLAYGDSLTEGWMASGPPHCWPAVAARRHGLDVVNLGYAGSCRGEIAIGRADRRAAGATSSRSAYGTNCWTRIPHSRALFRGRTCGPSCRSCAQGHPETPIVVCQPGGATRRRSRRPTGSAPRLPTCAPRSRSVAADPCDGGAAASISCAACRC